MATTTTTTVASPVDFETYGDYAPPAGAYLREGNLTSLIYPIDGRISDDGSTAFAAESGRYHLYFSLYCPWAQRPLIALKLRGLEDVVSWSAVDPVRDGRGWAFREGAGHGPDPVNGFTLLRDAYLATDPTFDGHVSVPALWDRATRRLVSNHYATMTVDLETCFTELADPSVELYPEGTARDRRGERRDRARPRGGTYAASARVPKPSTTREPARSTRSTDSRTGWGRAGSSLPTTSPTPTSSSTSTSCASTLSRARSAA
jgi:hypothetical protein